MIHYNKSINNDLYYQLFITMTVKQKIKEYVDDHYTHFGFYPYDVEVDGQIYSYGGYWAILEDRRFD